MPELQHGAQSARCVVCCFTGHAGHAENCSDMQTYVDNELWQCTVSMQQKAAGEWGKHVSS